MEGRDPGICAYIASTALGGPAISLAPVLIAANALLPSEMDFPCTVNAKRRHMRTDTRWIKDNAHVKGIYQYEGSFGMSM